MIIKIIDVAGFLIYVLVIGVSVDSIVELFLFSCWFPNILEYEWSLLAGWILIYCLGRKLNWNQNCKYIYFSVGYIDCYWSPCYWIYIFFPSICQISNASFIPIPEIPTPVYFCWSEIEGILERLLHLQCGHGQSGCDMRWRRCARWLSNLRTVFNVWLFPYISGSQTISAMEPFLK